MSYTGGLLLPSSRCATHVQKLLASMTMKSPKSVKALEDLGRIQLSPSFYMRDFLYSEISQIEGIPNILEYPDKAIETGKRLCQEVIEPIQQQFGRVSIRSGYRSPRLTPRAQRTKINTTVPAMKRTTAFNINWSSDPIKRIDSYVPPKGCLTKAGEENHSGSHAELYAPLLKCLNF